MKVKDFLAERIPFRSLEGESFILILDKLKYLELSSLHVWHFA